MSHQPPRPLSTSTSSGKESIYKFDNKTFIPTPTSPFDPRLLHSKLPVSLAFKRTCYKCGNLGHHADDCSSNERLCYNCKQPGHESSKCPNDRSAESKQCYFCKEVGHIQSDCPKYKTMKEEQNSLNTSLFSSNGNGMKKSVHSINHEFNNNFYYDPYDYPPSPRYHIPQIEYIQDPSILHQQQLDYQTWLYNQQLIHSQALNTGPIPLHLHYTHVIDYNPAINQAKIPIQHRYDNRFIRKASPHHPRRSLQNINQVMYHQYPPYNYPQHYPQHLHLHQHQNQINHQYNNLIQLRSHSTPTQPFVTKSQPNCYSCGEVGHEVCLI